MDTTISIHPLTSSQFLSVCNYITSFGIFLNNLGFIKTDERNQTVPTLNALFEYLNKFENQSEMKMKILRALFNDTSYHSRENKILDMKIAEEHYRYVINTTLFSHYGYITGYLAEIINERDNITSSMLKKKVFQHLTENYINNDQCSSIKGSSKLTLLAIERIFMDYILPIFTKTWTTEKNLSDEQKGNFQLKRLKRNPDEHSDEDVDDRKNYHYESKNLPPIFKSFENIGPMKRILEKENWNISPKVRKIENEQRGLESEISNKVQHLDEEYDLFSLLMMIKKEGLSVLMKDKEAYKKFSSQINALADQQRNEEWMKEPIELWLRQPLLKINQGRYLENLKGKSFNFNNITLLTKRKSGYLPHHLFKPFSKTFEMQVVYHLTSDTQYGFVDLGRFNSNFTDLFITFPNVTFIVTNTVVLEDEYKRTTYLALKRNLLTKQELNNIDDTPSTSRKSLETMMRNRVEERKTERMQIIEENAKYISSANCKPIRGDFMKSVDMLKGYLLKLEKLEPNTYKVPTYDELAKDYCENELNVPKFYKRWSIKNGKYIDDVLFENKFYFPENIDLFRHNILRVPGYRYTVDLISEYIEYTTNLLQLQKSIRFEDFFNLRKRMKRYLFIPVEKTSITRNQTLSALYRLGLKQCNEEWTNKNPITLYQANIVSSRNYKKYSKYINLNETIHTVDTFERFSLLENVEVNNIFISRYVDIKILLFKIELKGHVCGISNINRVFPIEKGSHIFLLERNFFINNTKIVRIKNRDVYIINLIPLLDIPKEDKMVSIVNELNTIFSTGIKYYMDEN